MFYFNQKAKILDTSFKQSLILDTKIQIIPFVLKNISKNIFI